MLNPPFFMKQFFLIVPLALVVYSFNLKDNGKILFEEPFHVPFNYDAQYSEITYLSQGLRIKGFLIKPIKKKHKYPLIIYNRGGNRSYGKITKNDWPFLYGFAKEGFVILASQYRGCDGCDGKDEFGGGDLNDVLNLLTTAEKLEYIDMNNIFMVGISRGGMMTYMALHQEKRIKAAAIIAGVANLFITSSHRPEMKNIFKDLIPQRNLEMEYAKRSATFWADEIEAPLIIFHGEMDSNVTIHQVDLLVKRLTENHKTFEYIVYHDCDHYLLKKYQDEIISNICRWFKKYMD